MRISDWSSDVCSSDLPSVSPLPLDRVRAFVTLHRPQHWATAGVLAANGGADAPYFTCLALAGRPDEQLHNLLRGFPDLVEKYCGCERCRVRGPVISLSPQAWSIGGEPALSGRGGQGGRGAR